MKNTTLTPYGKRIVVRRFEAAEKSKGGIVIPDSVKEKPKQGKVLAVGDVPDLKEGDTVFFGPYAGAEIDFGDESFLVLKDEEILAKFGGELM